MAKTTKKKKPRRARRTPKVTRTDSRTAAKGRAAREVVRKISLTASDDSRLARVRAVIIGPFGVHRLVWADGSVGESYTVTHVLTGAATGHLSTKALAVRYASALAKRAPISWDFTDPKTISMRKWARVAKVAERIKKELAT